MKKPLRKTALLVYDNYGGLPHRFGNGIDDGLHSWNARTAGDAAEAIFIGRRVARGAREGVGGGGVPFAKCAGNRCVNLIVRAAVRHECGCAAPSYWKRPANGCRRSVYTGRNEEGFE